MYWTDEAYLLSKNNFDENSIIIETFTLNHGKYTGIVYGGSSRKQKRNFQIGNKILLNWKSKNQNKSGYFNTELIKPVSPFFFDDKRRTICIAGDGGLLFNLQELQTVIHYKLPIKIFLIDNEGYLTQKLMMRKNFKR